MYVHGRSQTRRIKKKSEQGFTLIEVMIGIMLFTIGILAVSAMALQAFNGFGIARTGTEEVNRTVKIIDTLRSALYSNNQIFNGNGQAVYPFGADQAIAGCWDFNNLVVRDVKLIAVENSQMRGPSPSNNYRLYFIKEGKPQIN